MVAERWRSAALLGASDLTEIGSDVLWINAVRNKFMTERIGDAHQLAHRILKQAGPEYPDITLGANFLVDPALRLHPQVGFQRDSPTLRPLGST